MRCSFSRIRTNSTVHSFPTRRSSDLGRSFMILEYNETVQRAVGQMAPSPDGVHTIVDETAAPAEGMEKLWEFLANNISYRSEEHTSELQSREKLVCRLLLEKKKQDYK